MTAAIILGDSIWRDALRTLTPAQSWSLAQDLQTELDADPAACRRVVTASLDDARARMARVNAADHWRLLFCPESIGVDTGKAVGT